MRWSEERQAVLDASKRMAQLGLVVGSAGNVSARIRADGRDLLAITPNRKRYGQLTVEEIVVVDFEGEPVEGDLVPSSETLMHACVYKARPEVRAVAHTHSVYATTLAVAALPLPPILDELVTYVGGEVQVAEYGMAGTEDLAAKAVAALGERNAVLLRNHGMLGVGASPEAALDVCLLVERAAQVYLLARGLGQAHRLPEEAVEVEKAYFRMLHPKEE